MGVLAHDFAGQRVLVTGGTRGVGLEVAHAFVDAGAEVTVTGTKVIPSLYDADLSRFDFHQLNLTRRESIDYLLAKLGRIDILINAAGAALPTSLDAHEREFIAHSARLGLLGPAQLTTRLRFKLSESKVPGGGAVVNTASTRRWFELTTSAEAARSDLIESTRRMGQSWSRHGARVNTVLEPAATGIPRQYSPAGQSSGSLMVRPRQAIREDVASVVLFLAGSDAAGLTGHTLQLR